MAVLHPPLAEAPEEEWVPRAARLVEAVRAAVSGASLREERADALIVVASSAGIGPALDAAFAAVASARSAITGHFHGRPIVSVGIGWGVALPSPYGPVGPEVLRAWKLATLGTGEVLSTESLVRSGAMPPGVGSFRAPAGNESMAGMPAYVLADFRF